MVAKSGPTRGGRSGESRFEKDFYINPRIIRYQYIGLSM